MLKNLIVVLLAASFFTAFRFAAKVNVAPQSAQSSILGRGPWTAVRAGGPLPSLDDMRGSL